MNYKSKLSSKKCYNKDKHIENISCVETLHVMREAIIAFNKNYKPFIHYWDKSF